MTRLPPSETAVRRFTAFVAASIVWKVVAVVVLLVLLGGLLGVR